MPPTRSQTPTRNRAKRWCFTLNNPTPLQRHALAHFAINATGLDGRNPNYEYLVYGNETAPTTGTPHIQGYVIFTVAKSLRQAKSALSGPHDAPFHLEVARGTPQQNREYCIKDGDFVEHGECPTVSQGRRTDLDRFFDWCDEFAADNGRAPTTPEAARMFPTVVVKYGRLMEVVRLRVNRELFAPEPEPREWQQRLSNTLEEPPDDRKIHFVVDPDGGIGKSWFARWFIDTHPETTQIFRPSKVQDIAYAVKTHVTTFIFDVPRGGMQYLQSQVLEMLKDRVLFSPKYNSTTKYLAHVPHVVVLSNEHPADVGIVLTEDRYNFIDIN